MTEPVIILLFTALYGLSLTGGKGGRSWFAAGFSANVVYIGYRWMSLGRMPVTERFDILIVTGALLACGYFYFRRRMTAETLVPVLSLFVVTFCFFAVFQDRMDTIEPNMNSGWFTLYILLFIAGFAFLAAGSVAGLLYLLEKDPAHERMQYRISLFGWLLFSFSLIAGSVWFYRVHGVYWLWTAKELWMTISWFYYGFYLHARMVSTLSGRAASFIGTAGFGVMLFSYLGVTPILGSPWSQF